MNAPADEPMDAGAMPTAFEARSEFEAQCVRAVLEDAGIACVVVPSGTAIFGFPLRAGGRTIPVRVLPDDLSRAKQAISEAKFVGRSIDWDEVDLGEEGPDVARTLSRTRRVRRTRMVVAAIVWIFLIAVALSAVAGLVRAVVGHR
jgi:hypothetical protein